MMAQNKAAVGQASGPLLIGLSGVEVCDEEVAWLRHAAVGGVVLFSRNYTDVNQLTALCRSIRRISGREILICVDHEGGRVQRFRDGFTRLPALAVLGKLYRNSAQQGLDFAYRHGRVMATELLLCGVDLSFAPVLDLGGRSVVIGDRAFDTDIGVINQLAGAYIAGMRDAGMACTGKHFPGHGSVIADTHTDDVLDPRPLEEIEQADLKTFTALAGQLNAVMMAHVLYPQVDSKPAGYSKTWVREILREKLGFTGVVFSDDLGMYAARSAGSLTERVHESLLAGCDGVLVCDPADVRTLLADPLELPVSKTIALSTLEGKMDSSREDIERVGEWRQWKKSIAQLAMEQSQWL
jgi:beta-N-acetylhexosaminidase